MSAQTETYQINGDDLTLSRVIWQRYRQPVPGVVEQTLALNPGLALNLFIPRGTVLTLPVVKPTSIKQIALVKLW